MRWLIAALALAAIVAGVMLTGGRTPERIPLHEVPQGLAIFDLKDAGRVFVRREGNLLWGWRQQSKAGHDIAWCPREHVFWSPQALTLYDLYGNIERAVEAGRDPMVRLIPDLHPQTLAVRFVAGTPRDRPPKAGVPKPTREFYERWLSRHQIPGGNRLRWCPSPQR